MARQSRPIAEPVIHIEWPICESLNEDSLSDLAVVEQFDRMYIEVNGERCIVDADDAMTMAAVLRSCVKRIERRKSRVKGVTVDGV